MPFAMALWLKVLFWIAVVVLPGGVLLLPLAVAVHRRRPQPQPAGEPPSRS